LQLSHVTVKLSGRTIISDITFDIGQGEIVTLIGPNGAGKTTLLRLILGLMPATSGHIWRHPKWHVGYMPQRIQINPHMPLTVRRFLEMYALQYQADGGVLDHALQTAGAGNLEHQSIHTLSGGELQRVMLARALMNSPNVLILDEPTQAIDIAGQRDFYQLMTRLAKESGLAVILVSHDLHMVMAASDKVLCLNGHICCAGTPKAVQTSEAYLQLFGPGPFQGPIEELAYYPHDHTHDHHHAPDPE